MRGKLTAAWQESVEFAWIDCNNFAASSPSIPSETMAWELFEPEGSGVVSASAVSAIAEKSETAGNRMVDACLY